MKYVTQFHFCLILIYSFYPFFALCQLFCQTSQDIDQNQPKMNTREPGIPEKANCGNEKEKFIQKFGQSRQQVRRPF